MQNTGVAIEAPQLLTIDDVMAQLSWSKFTVYNKIKTADFPKPVHIGGTRSSRWLKPQVDQWLLSQIADQVDLESLKAHEANQEGK